MKVMGDVVWAIPSLSLLSFLIMLLFGRKLKENAAYISIGLTGLGFILALIVLFGGSGVAKVSTFNWLTIGGHSISMGISITPLNALMLVIVTFVSFLVHLYSKGYMHGDERFPVFYEYLGLFTFSMLSLVVSPNLLQLYIFWELVGVCSFLLVGFYFDKESAKAAAKKAFIVTRIGDVGLFIAIILIYWQVGSFSFSQIFTAVQNGSVSPGMVTLIGILIFIGAMGKSGQFPLHTWLPDAMEGPTPVSALIHAATMVAAGVYLVADVYPIFQASHTALMFVAIIGGFTAIFAATIGTVQNDIKRVLAYSTVSQLGYMMLALGSAGYVAGIFHLFTHAFFKALLFLAAGSIIHAVDTQDLREMGGLWRKIRVTAWTFLFGSLSISGVPFFSGSFSKDDILTAAYDSGNTVLFIFGVVAAFFTAFYMFRLYFMVFAGKPRSEGKHVHESPKSMLIPMIVLAFFAIFAGYLNSWFGHFIGDFLQKMPFDIGAEPPKAGTGFIQYLTAVLALLGIFTAWLMYVKKAINVKKLAKTFSFVHRVLYNKYYIDEFYQATLVLLTKIISYILKFIDDYIVNGLVYLVRQIVVGVGYLVRRLQTGQVQASTTFTIFGLAVLLVIAAIRGGYFQW